ncbi:unnamed protein product, partial [marine sediment metagenome]
LIGRIYCGYVEWFVSKEVPSDTVFYMPRYSLIWFLIGNAFYYLTAIVLAAVLKDNRAFCKPSYLTPYHMAGIFYPWPGFHCVNLHS